MTLDTLHRNINAAHYDLACLTREQVVALVGNEIVEKLDNENCDYHSVENGLQRWTASITLGDGCVDVIAWYYMPTSSFYREDGEPIEDGGELDWQIDHYSIQ